MDCYKSIKNIFKINISEEVIEENIQLHHVLKIQTCCGVSDYIVIQDKEKKYKLYDLYNKEIPNKIMIEIKDFSDDIYYKKVDNVSFENINDLKNVYPILKIVNLEKVEGLSLDEFFKDIENTL